MKNSQNFRKRLSEQEIEPQEFEGQMEVSQENDLSSISDIDLYSLSDKSIQILIARIKGTV